MSKQALTALEAAIAKQTASFAEEIKALREEVSSLRAELAANTAAANAAATAAAATTTPCASCILMQARPPAGSRDEISTGDAPLWSDVVNSSVKTAVKTALHDEKAKSEIVITKMPENNRDHKDLDDLCTRMQFPARPTSITRLGKDTTNLPRPIKVTFPTPFEARAFLAKAEAVKREGDADLKKIRCRPCRNSDEQTRYLKLKDEVAKLNETAVAKQSYSLRNNGEVWKFAEDAERKWKRVRDWTYTPSANSTPPSSPAVSAAQRPEN